MARLHLLQMSQIYTLWQADTQFNRVFSFFEHLFTLFVLEAVKNIVCAAATLAQSATAARKERKEARAAS
jgi:hypothetical protein